MKPGIYSGIPNAVYQAGDEYSSSQLKPLREGKARNTLQHWKYDRAHQQPYKLAWSLGTLVHGITLEAERSQQIFRIGPCNGFSAQEKPAWIEWLSAETGKELQGNLTKAKILQWIKDNLTFEVVTPAQYETGLRMVESIYRNPDAREALKGGEAELSVYGKDDETGLPIRVRPDYWSGGLIPDIKTCASASPRDFERQAESLGYDLQAAMYLYCASQYRRAESFLFICVESDPPHVCQCYVATDQFLEAGWTDYRYAINKIKAALDSGKYGGYSDGMLDIDPPRWKQRI